MYILGFNGGQKGPDDVERHPARHDAAAVLLHNGVVVAAIEQERLDRLKHSNCFPEEAIRFCLAAAGIGIDEVEIIATNTSEATVSRWARRDFLFDPDSNNSLEARMFLAEAFHSRFGVDASSRFHFCPHHIAHAVSAFIPSGFAESLVVALDGDGDGISGMVLLGRETGLEKIREFSYQQSLGHLYTESIALLGYGLFDEYKVMGLAPYGNPEVFKYLFEDRFTLLGQGNYHLDPLPRWLAAFESAGLIPLARRKGSPFSQVHMDFAAALQATIETIILHVLRFYRESTGQANLCLAGGVAHNCSANGKLLASRIFRNVFVQPASHDAGGALGAALHAWSESRSCYRPNRTSHVFWGTDVSSVPGISGQLEQWSPLLDHRLSPDVASETADLIASGYVVGWVQGRSEFGPRALGNRSILADPRPAENKRRINRMVKKREDYRPFAPSVLEEHALDYFELTEDLASLPFMITISQVRPEKRALLGAVTHVDGSARVQTVSHSSNPKYWRLINEFYLRTGVPILLNTSLNNNAEPIVDSVHDAVTCFLTTGIDYLVIDGFIVSKRSPSASPIVFGNLIPNIMAGFRLIQERRREVVSYQLESVKSSRLRKPVHQLSPYTFQVLERTDGRRTLGGIFDELGLAMGRNTSAAVIGELKSLWSDRVISLRAPVRAGVTSVTQEKLTAVAGS